MASPSTEPLRRPVRVLVRTPPAQLEKIRPSVNQADTKLIEKFWVQQSGSTDTVEICYLIAKISDWKGSERADIIFSYGVPSNDYRPRVMAFNNQLTFLSTYTIKS